MDDHTAKGSDPTAVQGQPSFRRATTTRSAKFLLTSVRQRFSANQGTDMAATLTYYAVFALFPSLLAIVSIMKLSGIGDTLLPEFTRAIEEAVPDAGSVEMLVGLAEGFFSSTGAGLGLVIGILTAMWGASGYVAAFATTMNRICDVGEGRNPVFLKIQQFVLTAIALVLVVAVLAAVVLSEGVVLWLGELVGFGDGALRVWKLTRWPFIVAVAMALIAMLYHFSPNVRFPRYRHFSWGSVLAVLTAAVAASGFSFYVSNFGNYNLTYGALAGVMIALLLVWLVNLALVLGAHVDCETLRLQQLRSGLPAERGLQLDRRATKGIVKAEQAANKLAAQGHQIRVEADLPTAPGTRPARTMGQAADG